LIHAVLADALTERVLSRALIARRTTLNVVDDQ